MRIGDIYVSKRNIINALGSVKTGELFVLINIYRATVCDPETVYRFKHKDSNFVFSTYYVGKWFEPIGSNMKIKEEMRDKLYEYCKQDAEMKTVLQHRVQMVNSYANAIRDCGGSPDTFINKMDSMTVQQMINVLAQNGVRFTTEKKERDMWDNENTETVTQQSYLSGQWIVGSINKRTGEVSFAKRPKVHASRAIAVAEAKRLASTATNKEFMAVQIGAIASSVEVVVR